MAQSRSVTRRISSPLSRSDHGLPTDETVVSTGETSGVTPSGSFVDTITFTVAANEISAVVLS